MVGKISINGSEGEGGGQVLRTSLALSALLGQEVQVSEIRAGRKNPGLKAQHLTGVNLLSSICSAETIGVKKNSTKIDFKPIEIKSLDLTVSVGTAGSLTLLIQQILPVSLVEDLKIKAIGGTHVAFSPSLHFVQKVLLPKLKKSGIKASVELIKPGFFPKGKGKIFFESKKAKLPIKPINITELGELEYIECFSFSSALPDEVVKNQFLSAKNFLRENLTADIEFIKSFNSTPTRNQTIGSSIDLFAHFSSGNIISGNAIGRKGMPAEKVGKQAAQNLLEKINLGVACDFNLADQLIPFMALAKGKSKIETILTEHTKTNIKTTEKFLEVKFNVQEKENNKATIEVEGIGFTH